MVTLDSSGGAVEEAVAIGEQFDEFVRDGYRVSILIERCCDSAALIIAMSGTSIWARVGSSARLHHFSADDPTDASAVREAAALEQMANRKVLQRSRLTAQALADLVGADTRVGASDLVSFGLADGLVGPREFPPEATA